MIKVFRDHHIYIELDQDENNVVGMIPLLIKPRYISLTFDDDGFRTSYMSMLGDDGADVPICQRYFFDEGLDPEFSTKISAARILASLREGTIDAVVLTSNVLR